MKPLRGVRRFLTFLIQRAEGSALVVSLLIMLCLVLLGLALLLQSNTEYVIALNERDSTAALYDAEAALQLSKRFIAQNGTGSTLTPLLTGGPQHGILGLHTINTGIDASSLNDDCSAGSATCETTTSVLVNREGAWWEAFRIGVDRDGSTPAGRSGWDGPRGMVYVRIEDNHDDEPNSNDFNVDTDKRINAYIISEFPIMTNSNGIAVNARSTTQKSAGLSTRRLFAQFGPSAVKPAIATDGDFDLQGSADVCGACGSVHANQTLTLGADDVDTCGDATSTATAPVRDDGGTAQIGGTIAQADRIDIPIANPFHENYVPSLALFNTTGDVELTGFPELQCNTTSGKYFAFIGDHGSGKILKAYWNAGTSVWDWQLIDDLSDTNNTILDDCGRVVSSNVHAADAGAGTGGHGSVDDGSKFDFYGFSFSSSLGGPGGPCTGDKTLASIANNDFDGPGTKPSIGVTYMVPGTGGIKTVPDDVTHKDGNRDFIYTNVMKIHENKWRTNASNVYSPLYNAVLYFYGNVDLLGNLRNLVSSAGTKALPANIWRATFLSFNNIDAAGTPAYAPVRSFDVSSTFQYLLVAGRDIEVSGTPGGGNLCPASCSDAATNLAGYAGYIYAHEQISLHGNVSVNGIVESEDAANCSTLVGEPGIITTGSVQVYYDCVHPPSEGGERVNLQSWQEIQGNSF